MAKNNLVRATEPPIEAPVAESASDIWEVAPIPAHDHMAIVARDARNLLGALTANVDWLRSGLTDKSPPLDLMSGLADIETCCERLTSLLEDALVGTRSNGLTPRLSMLSIGLVLATAQKQVRKMGEACGVSVEIATDCEVAAILDRELLTRALVKLIGRAIEESPRGALISLQYRLQDDMISISISRGTGSLVSLRPSLPAPESAERTKLQSSDLVFCRMVAESHGGALSLGAGLTMYRLSLPWVGPADR